MSTVTRTRRVLIHALVGLLASVALGAASATNGTAAASAGYPPHKSLNVQWEVQKNWCSCGAATARMLLKLRMGSRAPSQYTLQKRFGTTACANGQGTHRTEMKAALNAYLQSSFYRVYEDGRVMWHPEGATAAQKAALKRNVVASVYRGHGVALGILTPGYKGARPMSGYPSVDHWVAIVGYQDWGNRLLIADPINNSRVPEKYWVSINDVGKYIKVYVGMI